MKIISAGQKIIDFIIRHGIVSINYNESSESNPIMIWNANAEDQLTAKIKEITTSEPSIIIGEEYDIYRRNGVLWISKADGEGGQFNEEAFKEHIRKFYDLHF